MVELFGPAPGERPARRYGPVRRVAVLSDVHANTPALETVLAEAGALEPDLVVFCGDLTWGPEPARTVELVRSLGDRAVFLRGNAERAVLQMAAGERAPETARDHWMLARHQDELVAFLAPSRSPRSSTSTGWARPGSATAPRAATTKWSPPPHRRTDSAS
jgi:predicted MPP superfamily phosphohydrolase